MDLIQELDTRNRISLSKVENKADIYKVVEEPDGTVVLHPAVVMTKLEERFLRNPDLVAAIKRADDVKPEERRKWERKTPRR
ncbi:hypothetical protein GS506_16005 [Rhodococcus hoagii]|nr:hypothetical protein [Prescottella equi]